LSNPEQFVLTAAKLTGKPDILRSFFKQFSQEFALGAQWLFRADLSHPRKADRRSKA